MIINLNDKQSAAWRLGYRTTMFVIRQAILCPICFADNLLQKIKTVNSPHANGQRAACTRIKEKFKGFDCWACRERGLKRGSNECSSTS